MINLGGGPPEGEDARRFHKASLEFAARARPHEDDAAIQRDLGVVQMLAGDFDPAGDALQIAMGLEADRPTVRFLLGMVRFGQRRLGRGADAVQAGAGVGSRTTRRPRRS